MFFCKASEDSPQFKEIKVEINFFTLQSKLKFHQYKNSRQVLIFNIFLIFLNCIKIKWENESEQGKSSRYFGFTLCKRTDTSRTFKRSVFARGYLRPLQKIKRRRCYLYLRFGRTRRPDYNHRRQRRRFAASYYRPLSQHK